MNVKDNRIGENKRQMEADRVICVVRNDAGLDHPVGKVYT